MPSHLEDGKKIWPSHVSALDVKGNQFADDYASISAKGHELDSVIANPTIYSYTLVKKIQKRIIAIIRNLPDRDKKQIIRSQKELKPSIESITAESEHVLVGDQGRYTCQVCASSFKSTDSLFQEFITSSCTAQHTSALSHCRPTPIDDNFMHVGNQFIHHSHKLNIYRGFVYCGKCGCKKGTNQVRLLAKPCAPPGLSGIRNLVAIQEGKLPHGYTSWPDEDSGDGSSDELMFY